MWHSAFHSTEITIKQPQRIFVAQIDLRKMAVVLIVVLCLRRKAPALKFVPPVNGSLVDVASVEIARLPGIPLYYLVANRNFMDHFGRNPEKTWIIDLLLIFHPPKKKWVPV